MNNHKGIYWREIQYILFTLSYMYIHISFNLWLILWCMVHKTVSIWNIKRFYGYKILCHKGTCYNIFVSNLCFLKMKNLAENVIFSIIYIRLLYLRSSLSKEFKSKSFISWYKPNQWYILRLKINKSNQLNIFTSE